MKEINHKTEKKWKPWLSSLKRWLSSLKNWLSTFNTFDDYFVLFGIILNAFSLAISFAYGHIIAGSILSICELILIGTLLLKLF